MDPYSQNFSYHAYYSNPWMLEDHDPFMSMSQISNIEEIDQDSNLHSNKENEKLNNSFDIQAFFSKSADLKIPLNSSQENTEKVEARKRKAEDTIDRKTKKPRLVTDKRLKKNQSERNSRKEKKIELKRLQDVDSRVNKLAEQIEMYKSLGQTRNEPSINKIEAFINGLFGVSEYI